MGGGGHPTKSLRRAGNWGQPAGVGECLQWRKRLRMLPNQPHRTDSLVLHLQYRALQPENKPLCQKEEKHSTGSNRDRQLLASGQCLTQERPSTLSRGQSTCSCLSQPPMRANSAVPTSPASNLKQSQHPLPLCRNSGQPQVLDFCTPNHICQPGARQPTTPPAQAAQCQPTSPHHSLLPMCLLQSSFSCSRQVCDAASNFHRPQTAMPPSERQEALCRPQGGEVPSQSPNRPHSCGISQGP